MPLARYQIRNEYGLADAELYKCADRDDPEALLEGVAMAGLVGVMRQLGDLAEFAAEVFHDLHEEVMATAARGHGLMSRVKQLETEVSSIEKAFLSQTDHSPFFTNAGVDWHPNLRTEQNLITSGDLPRFVMDSYEECRGPPRLFLLDKFDVAGAGACLKRYSDPSLFKVEVPSTATEVWREKKIRKVKKKGSRWRNGETPEIMPTSHAKLHQLFLEERIENGHSDPARVVKLKRRPLNGSVFDTRPGKSYMEKFLGSPSPEHKVVCEASINQNPLRLTMDNSSESGLEILEIGTVSPARKPSQGNENSGSPTAQDVLKSFTHELDEEIVTREIVKVQDPISGGDNDASPCVEMEDELTGDGDRKTEESLEENHSDDLMSEVDNYMDALNTMESEMETDNEYKPKNATGFWKVEKHNTDYEPKEEHLDARANLSDSQSFGNFSTSDDGKSSFKKGRSGFSYADSLSNVTENTLSDSEGPVEVFPSSNTCAAEILDSPLEGPPSRAENFVTQSTEHIVYNRICNQEDAVPNTVEASCSSCVSDLNSSLPPSAPVVNTSVVSSSETVLEEVLSECVKLCPEPPKTDQNDVDVPCSSINLSGPSPEIHKNLLAVSSEGRHVEEVVCEDPNMSIHTSNLSDPEKEGDDGYENRSVQTVHADRDYSTNLIEGKTDSPHLDFSPSKELFHSPVLPEVDVDTGSMKLFKSLGVAEPVEIDSKTKDVTTETGVSAEILTGAVEPQDLNSIEEQKCSDTEVDVLQYVTDLTDVGSKVDVVGRDSEDQEVDSKVDVASGDSEDHSNNYSEKPGFDDHVNLNEAVVASHVVGVSVAKNDASVANCLVVDLVSAPSSDLVDIQESLHGNREPYQTELDLPKCHGKLVKRKEVQQLDIVSADVNSSSPKSVSDGKSNLDVLKNVHESVISDETQSRSSSNVADNAVLPSSKLDLEWESKDAHVRHSIDISEHAVNFSTPFLAEAGTALEQDAATSQIIAESAVEVMDEANPRSFDSQHSPPCQLEESRMSRISSEQPQELQCNQPELGCLQTGEASPNSSNMQYGQIAIMSDMSQERCFNLSSEQPPQSTGQEVDAMVLSKNLFGSPFPSFGAYPQNLEELPPLPPLPPMQWRLGKFQPAPVVLPGGLTDHGQGSFLPAQPFAAYEEPVVDSVPLSRETVEPSNPFLSVTSADSWKSDPLPAASVKGSERLTSQVLEMPASATGANRHDGNLPLKGTQDLNPLSDIPDIRNEGPDDSLLASRGNPAGSSSDSLTLLDAVEPMRSEHDSGPPPGLQSKYLSQVAPESIAEAKAPENSLQNAGEENNSLDMSLSQSSLLDDQPQHDVITPHGETTWPQTTLALPLTYEVGKPNGSKLPRPRNPLIDAVAAHDKSKLRKVTERDRPQVGPKVDERDSLLEQIRTKSFNLKPTAVTRPNIQGIQGPKTNLKVAAILEKASAIRQALAGSDEDDSDSWSDS